MTEEQEELISANKAGKLLGKSGKTVIRLMESGAIPGYKIGGTWSFKRGEIKAYINQQRFKPEVKESK